MSNAELHISVVRASGDEVAAYCLPGTSKTAALKEKIAVELGMPPSSQQLLCDSTVLKDDESLGEGSLVVTLLTLTGAPQNLHFASMHLSGEYLEEFRHVSKPRVHWNPESHDYWGSRAHVDSQLAFEQNPPAGVEPDTGLLVLFSSSSELLCWLPESRTGFSTKLLGWSLPDSDAELHVLQAPLGMPLPSLGFVAVLSPLAQELSILELIQGTALAVQFGADGQQAAVTACCLDRETADPHILAAELQEGGFCQIWIASRTSAASPAKFFQTYTEEARHRPVTSVAVVRSHTGHREAIALTHSGLHAVFVYSFSGEAASAKLVQVVGRPKERGCQVGTAEEARFWFPYSDPPFPFGPLLTGPGGSLFLMSGGALRSLSTNRWTVAPAGSIREELWLTEEDWGTPELGDPASICGIHGSYLYRIVHRSMCRPSVLRRLRIDLALAQGRRDVREIAPNIWPDSLHENNCHKLACIKAKGNFAVEVAQWCSDSAPDAWDGGLRSFGAVRTEHLDAAVSDEMRQAAERAADEQQRLEEQHREARRAKLAAQALQAKMGEAEEEEEGDDADMKFLFE